MNIYRFLVLLVLNLSLDGSVFASDAMGIPSLKKDDFRVIDKATGRSFGLDEVFPNTAKTFGIPPKSPSLDPESNQFLVSYEGLKVWYLKESFGITTIRVESSNYVTPRGIAVGDSVDLLFSKYGKKEPTKGVYNYEYYPQKADQYGTCSFSFQMNNGRIMSILIYLAFDY